MTFPVGAAGSTLLRIIIDGQDSEGSPTLVAVDEPRYAERLKGQCLLSILERPYMTSLCTVVVETSSWCRNTLGQAEHTERQKTGCLGLGVAPFVSHPVVRISGRCHS